MDNSKHCLQITDAFPKRGPDAVDLATAVRRVSRAWVEPVDTVRKPCSKPKPEKAI